MALNPTRVVCRPAPPVVTAPSLLEIQLEQAKQLAEEQSQQELEAKVGCNYHHQ